MKDFIPPKRTVKDSGEIDLPEEVLKKLAAKPFKAPVNPRGLPIRWDRLEPGAAGAFVERNNGGHTEHDAPGPSS